MLFVNVFPRKKTFLSIWYYQLIFISILKKCDQQRNIFSDHAKYKQTLEMKVRETKERMKKKPLDHISSQIHSIVQPSRGSNAELFIELCYQLETQIKRNWLRFFFVLFVQTYEWVWMNRRNKSIHTGESHLHGICMEWIFHWNIGN